MLYRGVVVWNQRSKRDQWGGKRVPPRPAEASGSAVERPSCASSTRRSGRRAHERLAGARALYRRARPGQLCGRPANGIESKYLLTGLAACGGVRRVARGAQRRCKRRPAPALLRLQYLPRRGRRSAAIAVSRSCADRRGVLDAIEQEVLHPTCRARDREGPRRLRPARQRSPRARPLQARAARALDGRWARLTAAIRLGGPLASLVASFSRRAAGARAERAETLRPAARRPPAAPPAWRSFADWRASPRKHDRGRDRSLRELLRRRVVSPPRAQGGSTSSRRATFGRAPAGSARYKWVVTPAGFEPAISTLKGSRPWPG